MGGLNFFARMLSRSVKQAPRIVARLASSAEGASSEGAKQQSAGETKINMPAVAAVGVLGAGVAYKFLGRSEKTNMSSESDYPPNGLADSVKKKAPLSSGVTCHPSAQIFLSTIHSSLKIWLQSSTTNSRTKRPSLVSLWVT